MKRLILILSLLVGFVMVSSAQPHGKGKPEKDHEKMKKELMEFKMKYLADEMDLKDDQKQEFFELYQSLEEQRGAIYRPVMEMRRKLKHDKNATEADYQKVTDAMNTANAESAELEKKYDEKFSEFLSQKQLYKLKEAEKSFREKLQEMRRHKK